MTAATTKAVTVNDELAEKIRPWREVLNVHPAADMFPLMADDELRELADDIEKNGLAERIVYTGHADTPDSYVILDGRNRLDALALLGKNAMFGTNTPFGQFGILPSKYFEPFADHREDVPDITAWIISKNILRRHLTGAQKRELIAKLLTLTPEKSNRVIAKTVGVNDKTVGTVRNALEATAEIPQLTKTIGADGKARATKQTIAPTLPAKVTPKATPKAPVVTVATAPSTSVAAVHIADPDEVQAIVDQIASNLKPADLRRVIRAAIKAMAPADRAKIIREIADHHGVAP